MSRIRLIAGLSAAALAAVGLALAAGVGCGDASPPAPAPAPPPATPPGPDEMKERREAAEKISDAQRAKFDKHARGLLDSCNARVYRPVRDSSLQRAAGRIEVKAG